MLFVSTQPRLWFLTIGAALYLLLAGLGLRLSSQEDPRILAFALSADLCATLPALYALFVLRPAARSWSAALPLAWMGWVIALGLSWGEHLAGPIFFALPLVALSWKVWGRERLLPIAQQELSVLHLALASWRQVARVPQGARAFTQHQRSNHGPIVFALCLATAGELVAVHFLVSLWSETCAWILSGLSLYGALWLVADYRATVLRPILIDEAGLVLRAGLRFEVRLQPKDVGEFTVERPEHGRLSFTLGGEPRHWLRLTREARVRGPYGLELPARAIGLTVDDPRAFAAALEELVSR